MGKRKSLMLEKAVQERFIDLITNKIAIAQEEDNPIRIYKELVHYRFDEVITNAMPDFSEVLGSKRLDDLIFDFIQSKPTSPFVWKVPGLFMEYLVRNAKVEDIPYAQDLMWFESIEVNLLMGEYEKPKEEVFSWDERYYLTNSMEMKVLEYPVHQENFEDRGEYPLIMYYHFQEYAVYFQEITPFMFQFLNYLEGNSLCEALDKICKDFGVEEKDEVKALLEGALEEFVKLNIIRKRG